MDKDKLFEKLIFDYAGQEKNYDLLRHNLLRARSIMNKRHTSFKRLSAVVQFEYCLTIVLIAVDTSAKNLRKFSLSRDKKEHFKYSIDEGYTPPIPIELSKAVKKR